MNESLATTLVYGILSPMRELKGKKSNAGRLPCGRPVPGWDESQRSAGPEQFKVRFEALRKKLDIYVKARGLKQSDSRIKILEVVADYESHFSTSQLIARVAEAHPKVGAATVYRSIPFFVGAGILTETLATDSGEKIFEVPSTRHHDHIVCLDCDAILEFHESEIEALQQKVLKGLGFREARHRHVIYAHCEYRAKSKT